MQASKQNRVTDLVQFDEANSASGLLRRYTLGRIRSLKVRLFVAGFGCLALAVLVSPLVGIVAAFVTFSLEMSEHLMLLRLSRRKEFKAESVDRKVALASLMQVCGIGFCVSVAGIQSDALRLLAWSFLLGAALNSMLTAGYHPASHKARMVVLLITALGILLHGLVSGRLTLMPFVTEAFALSSMILMMWYLSRHLTRRETRMRKTERALIQRTEEATRLALVAEHASDSIILLDPDLRITWVNDQFSRLMGYSLQESVGRNPGSILNHPETSMETIEQIVKAGKNGTSVNVRILNRTKSGKSLWIDTHQTPVFDEVGEISAFIAVERDVTLEVAHEAKLREALIASKEADKEKTAFLSRMSHELRTPANGLIGGIDLLRDTQMNENQKDAVEILETSAGRLMQLVDNIVTVTDGSRGCIEVNLRKESLLPVFDSVLSVHQRHAKSRGIALRKELDAGFDVSIETDASLLHQILDRLLDNAIKFTNAGTVTLRAKILGGILRVEVEDTGVGIAQNRLPDIFEEFTMTDDETTRRFDGAGLGLASAENLVKLLGGRIDVRSELGKGSVFTVIIPITGVMAQKSPDHVAENASHRSKIVEKIRNEKSGGANRTGIMPNEAAMIDPKRLLVAEDNRTNRLLIKTMLKDVGMALKFAEDGLQAVEFYGKDPPDIVLMDLSMPNKNGWDATRDIRAIEEKNNLPRCPIVAVTANVSKEDRRKCVEAGMDAFLAKPLRKERLLNTIQTVGD